MIFEAGHQAISDRQALRSQVRQKCNALEQGVRGLRDASGAKTSDLQVEPLAHQTDVSATIAQLNALVADITALKGQRQTLEAELVAAREKQARLRKNLIILAIVLVVLIVIYNAI